MKRAERKKTKKEQWPIILIGCCFLFFVILFSMLFLMHKVNEKENVVLRPNKTNKQIRNINVADLFLSNMEKVAGASQKLEDQDGDGLLDSFEEKIGTDVFSKDTDGDGYSDYSEFNYGYDPTKEGKGVRMKLEVVIPKLDIKAKVITPLDTKEKTLQEALKKGVIRYPDTAIPGQKGTSFITGHSSVLPWQKNDYGYVFKDIYKLEKGDKINFIYFLSNGKRLIYQYLVTGQEIFAKDDTGLLKQSEEKEVFLVTCWPLYTDLKRMVVKAKLSE